MKVGFGAIAAVYLLGMGVSVSHAQATQDSNAMSFLGALDHRSVYGKGFFPEPLGTDEGDVEDEFSLNYVHQEAHGMVANEVAMEVEKSFGLLTIEVEAGYENERVNEDGDVSREEGLGNVEISARHPVYQYVSPNEAFDYTVVLSLEVSLPTRTEISKDGDVVPVVQNLIRVGDHFSLQVGVGWSTVVGPVDGGTQVLEYAATAGWNIDGMTFPLPKWIDRVTPLFEVTGERGLNRGDYDLIVDGTLGVRVNLAAIGALSPHLGIGYLFPINDNARDEMRWGVITSFVLEY